VRSIRGAAIGRPAVATAATGSAAIRRPALRQQAGELQPDPGAPARAEHDRIARLGPPDHCPLPVAQAAAHDDLRLRAGWVQQHIEALAQGEEVAREAQRDRAASPLDRDPRFGELFLPHPEVSLGALERHLQGLAGAEGGRRQLDREQESRLLRLASQTREQYQEPAGTPHRRDHIAFGL
jgi:hypothetical protein